MKTNSHLHGPHWTEEDLLIRIYGLDAREGLSEAHLDDCAECRAKLAALNARREALRAAPVLPEDRLRAQRQEVFRRIESGHRNWVWRMVPAAATALLLTVGIALHQGQPAAKPSASMLLAQSDLELLADIESLVAEDTPRAADPIRGLFVEASPQEVQ